MNNVISMEKIVPLFWQITRFGIVGVTAALVNYAIVILIVEAGLMQPLTANLIGFLGGFQVSYWGHRCWTFKSNNHHKITLPRLLVVSFFALIASESLFYLFMHVAHLHYTVALLFVLMIVPIGTFVANKFWVFN